MKRVVVESIYDTVRQVIDNYCKGCTDNCPHCEVNRLKESLNNHYYEMIDGIKYEAIEVD